jgi:hypothetical protein
MYGPPLYTLYCTDKHNVDVATQTVTPFERPVYAANSDTPVLHTTWLTQLNTLPFQPIAKKAATFASS